MSTEDALQEIQRSLGRIEARQEDQARWNERFDQRLTVVETRPARNWGAVGKWFAGITATVIAAVLAFKLKVVGR